MPDCALAVAASMGTHLLSHVHALAGCPEPAPMSLLIRAWRRKALAVVAPVAAGWVVLAAGVPAGARRPVPHPNRFAPTTSASPKKPPSPWATDGGIAGLPKPAAWARGLRFGHRSFQSNPSYRSGLGSHWGWWSYPSPLRDARLPLVPDELHTGNPALAVTAPRMSCAMARCAPTDENPRREWDMCHLALGHAHHMEDPLLALQQCDAHLRPIISIPLGQEHAAAPQRSARPFLRSGSASIPPHAPPQWSEY